MLSIARLGIDLEIYVFGVPPGSYSVNVTGLEVDQTTIVYAGALHVGLHYEALIINGYPQLNTGRNANQDRDAPH